MSPYPRLRCGSASSRALPTSLPKKNKSANITKLGDRLLFVDDGRIIEQGAPKDVFEHPQEERTRLFLSKVL